MTYIGLAIGAVLGAFQAYRRKGNILDILQYAAGYAIAFGLLAMFINIAYLRMG